MKTILLLTVLILSATTLFGQKIKIGFQNSIESSILNEKKIFIIKQSKAKKIFLTHGSKDFLYPERVIKNQLLNLTKLIESDENIVCKLKIYEEEGHVPYQSIYHGLKFLSE